jgi:hypothetical protein
MQCNGAQQFEKICIAQAQTTKAGTEKVEICKKISTECGIFYHPEISIP